MNIPEEQRQALLRFAEFQSKRLEAADDTTLMMTQLALYKLYERDPERVTRIIAGALSIYGIEGGPPWDKPS
jgi:hypothetical protein